jgi:hypothetical protein
LSQYFLVNNPKLCRRGIWRRKSAARKNSLRRVTCVRQGDWPCTHEILPMSAFVRKQQNCYVIAKRREGPLADVDRRYANIGTDEVHFGYLALEARCAALKIAAIAQRSLKGLSPSMASLSQTILENSGPLDDWVKTAQAMHRLTEAAASNQAGKCVWYYTQGPDKDARRRANQWSSLFLKFFAPKRMTA